MIQGYLVSVYRTGFMGVKFLEGAEFFETLEQAQLYALSRRCLSELVSCVISRQTR